MNWNRLLGMCLVSAVLTACGGGGGQAGTSGFGSNTNTNTNTNGSAAVSAASLSIALSANSIPNTNTDGVTATVTATDANGKTVPGANISYKVTGGSYTQSSATTDATGENKITVKLGADKANRTITIVATDGKNTATGYLTVTGARLSSTATEAVLAPNAAGSVIFRVRDAANAPIPNQTIEIRTSANATKTATTNINGEYTYDFTAPSTTGTFQVSATVAGLTATQDVLVQALGAGAIPNSATPTQMSLDVNPTVVSVNSSGSTSNAITVRALFKGDSNNALANVRVKFDLSGDANSVGGAFSVQEAFSDANGYAITSYIPGSKSSPTNGLTIRACWATTGNPSDVVCGVGNQLTQKVTVISDAVSVSIGSDENIIVDEDLVYSRRFVVTVVDGAGVARSGVTISPTLDITNYYKGRYNKPEGESKWGQFVTASCVNEDADRNNQLTPAEDVNNNGQLDPRKADASVSVVTSGGKTDLNGRVILKVTYNRSSASWIKYKLDVSGIVDGSEGRFSWIEDAPVPTSALSSESDPAFVVSPYGYSTNCTTVNPP